MGILLLVLFVLMGLGVYLLVVGPMAQRIAAAQFSTVAAKVVAGMDSVFQPTEQILSMSRGYIRSNPPSVESPDSFNRLLKPVLETLPEATSAVAGTSDGRGWMLLQRPDGTWLNRLTDVKNWGSRHLFVEQTAQGQVQRLWKNLDYDPRKRDWYTLAAMNRDGIQWTAPYEFFTTREIGITASTHVPTQDQSGFVLGLDLKLRDLSLTTMAAKVGRRGMALVLAEDMRVLALPAAPQGYEAEKWMSQLLKPASALGIAQLSDALGHWRPDHAQDIIKFTSQGLAWLVTVHPYALGHQRFWVLTLAPAGDFEPPLLPIVTVLGALLIMMLILLAYLASRISRHIAQPLETLAQASERFGQLELHEQPLIRSRISEVRRLAEAHERMRAMLLENQKHLAEQQGELKTQLQALRLAELRLEQSNAGLSATLLAIPDLLFEVSDAGEYINVWARNTGLLVAQREMLIGRTVADVLPAEAAETIMSAIREASTNGTSFGRIIALDLPDGRHWFELSMSAKSQADHGQRRFMVLSRDITDRYQADEALRESEQRYRTLISATSAVTWSCPPSGVHEKPQPQWMAFTGQTGEEMLGSGWTAATHPDDRTAVAELWQQSVRTGTPFTSEHRIRRHDGAWRWMKVYAVPILDAGGQMVEWFGMNLDVSDRREAEERIEHMAFHDPLTGLANRALFLDRLGQALAVARRKQLFGAIVFIDLDEFKNVNDVYGHGFGDKVLKEVAERLRQFLREGDTVARLGGDEFVILLPELSGSQESAVGIALTVGEKLRVALEEANQIEGQAYSATASLGVSLFPRRNETVEDLIREADIAMYRAKERGRNTLVFFEDDMQVAISERFALEQALRDAVRQGDFRLFLQSKVDRDGRVIGAEALVRWHHPVRGMVMPAAFIPLAEETGLISALGEWVLREACRLIVQLNAMGRSLHLAVNVSPRQFHQSGFVSRVKGILAETGADPLYLTLEITESLLVERASEVASRMLELAELGVRFSIDDFGTGYSSLGYLKRLPLNELKIDKSFVQDVPHDANDVAMVETILSMARHLGFVVVAEGVETQEQFNFLAARQCAHFQGYLFHRPQPAQEWVAGLQAGSR